MKTQIRPKTEDAIREAGFRLLSSDPSATLSDIAMLAGVGRATLHRYYASRDEFVSALALQALAEMDEAAEDAAADGWDAEDCARKILVALIKLGDRHGFLAHLPSGLDPRIDDALERQAQDSIEMIKQAQKDGAIDPALPARWIERQFDAAIMSAWESIRAEETTPQQAGDLAWRSLKHGWSPDNDR